MTNCVQLIKGICENNIDIKATILANYFQFVVDFVEANNSKHSNIDISPDYIFDSVNGIINLKYTFLSKNSKLASRIEESDFGELFYYLTYEIYRTELKLRNYSKSSTFFKILSSDGLVNTVKIKSEKLFAQQFDDVLQHREKELLLVHKMMKTNSMDEFKKAYFDMAVDIIHKSRQSVERLNDFEIKEYAKDIFSEAVLKLVTLIMEGKYVYEAKISSFLYWPMFNKWVKISKESGQAMTDDIFEKLPDTQRLYFENQLEEDEIIQFMKENFDKLSQREREILWMKEIEGYSYQEIKEFLGLDEEVNYLKQIKLRGKRNLQIKLSEDRRLRELL